MARDSDKGAVLDLLFIQDATASMGDYIESAKSSIIEICSVLQASGRLRQNDGLQVGLLAYRDYPEDSNEFVLKAHPFTRDLKEMEGYLAPLKPHGGGDLPEAFSTALDYAYTEMEGWRDGALKAIVVVTDAAPHGISEDHDDYPDGVPTGTTIEDPLQLAKDMAETGYSIFTLACDPKLGQSTKYAIDFYKSLSDKTLGRFCSLTDHKLLPMYIIGALLEKIDLRRLGLQYENVIRKQILEDGVSIDDVVRNLHAELSSKGQQVTNLQTGDMYNDLPDANENYMTFMTSDTLADARPLLREVTGPRINEGDLKAVQKMKREAERKARDQFTVSVRFRNLGDGRIELQTFDAELRAMISHEVVPRGESLEKPFRINVPVNFTVTFGRATKNFCKVFVDDAEIFVDAYFV